MKDDRPLLLQSDSEEVRALLRSADLDDPPDEAKRRVLAGAGVGVGLGIVAAATTATHAGIASQAAGKLGALAVGKWIAVAAVVGVGAAGTARYAGVMRSAAPVVATTRTAPSEPAPPAILPEPRAASAGETSELEGAEEPLPAAPRAVRPQKGTPAASVDISGEIAAIEAARRAFDRGNAREGLAALDRYQQDFPRGTLHPEATVLRIEGLVAVGDRAQARSVGESFLKSHPKSPHAQRVRSLIGSGNP